MERYKSIKILEENYGLPTKAEITLEDETVKVVEGDELWTILYAFATQEGYETSYDFIENCDKVIKEEEDVEIDEPVLAEEEEEEKKPKKRIALRIGAGLVAAVVGIGGISYVLVDHFSNKKGPSNSDNKPKKPYIQMVDYPEDEKNGLTDRVEVMDSKDETVREELIAVVDGKAESEQELEEFLSNQEALAWTNVTNISNFVNGKKLTGDVYKTDFYTIYDIDTVDYAAVYYFNGLRDNIVNAAYETNSVENTKNAIADFNQRFIKFVFGKDEFKYNRLKTEYTWDDLSPSAQNTILAMGMGILTIEHDFSIKVNNQTYNRLVTVEETYDLKQQVYEEILESQRFYKKNSK